VKMPSKETTFEKYGIFF